MRQLALRSVLARRLRAPSTRRFTPHTKSFTRPVSAGLARSLVPDWVSPRPLDFSLVRSRALVKDRLLLRSQAATNSVLNRRLASMVIYPATLKLELWHPRLPLVGW